MMMLSLVGDGESARVRQIDCGKGVSCRFSSLGIYVGELVRVVRNELGGPVIVEVKGSRIVIGRGQANKIMVELDGKS